MPTSFYDLSLQATAEKPLEVVGYLSPDGTAAAVAATEHAILGRRKPSPEFVTTPAGLITWILFTGMAYKAPVILNLGVRDLDALETQLEPALGTLDADPATLDRDVLRLRPVLSWIESGHLKLGLADEDDPRLDAAALALEALELGAEGGGRTLPTLPSEADRCDAAGRAALGLPPRFPTIRLTGDEIRAAATECGLPVVYSDGSARKSHGRADRAAWAWFHTPEVFDHQLADLDDPCLTGRSLGKLVTYTELKGAIAAIEHFAPSPIAIVVDATIVFDVVTGRHDHPLGGRLRRALRDTGSKLFLIKGHSDPDGHNRADRLARKASQVR